MAGDNAFVGYMYGTPTTYIDQHGDYANWEWNSASGTVKMGAGYTFDTKTGLYTLTVTIVKNTTIIILVIIKM